MADASRSLELPADALRRRVDPASLPFETTAEVEPLAGTIGQPRALDAIQFGLEVTAHGYNLFVTGMPGSGRVTTVHDHLERVARERPAPDDWVYVFNFAAPDRPNAIRLPAGRGSELARSMEAFLAAARAEIPRAFESDDYERRRREILAAAGQRRDAQTSGLEAFARERSSAVEVTPAGIVTVPLVDGKPLSGEAFGLLPPASQHEIERHRQEVQERVAGVVHELRAIEKEAAERIRELEREVVRFVTGPLLNELREAYAGEAEVLAYADQVEADLLDHPGAFRPAPPEPGPAAGVQAAEQEEQLARYRVNVVVGDGRREHAPVVRERNPTYYNLVGRIDYRPAFGTLVTDFRQIRAGALHRANGGFLVLEAVDLLRNPFAWDALKRALLTREVRIENLGEQTSALPTVSVRPEPVQLDLKVVLIGSPALYQLLYSTDEDFPELFKVRVDFSPEMDWTDEHVGAYAAFVSRVVRDEGLRHFDRTAVARVVEHGGRLREDQRRLSARLLDIADVVVESSFWAGKAGRELVLAEDVARAVRQKEHRSDRVAERTRELIADGTLMIDTAGERVGEVNGLSVLDLGDFRFGKPSRVSARVAPGRGSVRSIEREIELSGPIHSKGFLILLGYLSGTYTQDWPLALSATITFEQAYEGVDGDSASSTELYALLSALSGLPLRQSIAVTGSVNQHGAIQAVGGVTTKIEGFFAVCSARGLTGDEGVVVPAANVASLMLSDDVVDAVREGRFHVWAVRTVDEGIELLTGRPAGERGPDGAYPEGTVHRLVEDRLREYAERQRDATVHPAAPDGADDSRS